MTEVAHIPHHYARRRVENLFPGEIIYTKNKHDPYDFDDHPPVSHDGVTGELFVYKDALFGPEDLTPNSVMGRIGILRFMTTLEDNTTFSGVVVDLRRVTRPLNPAPYSTESVPDDIEEQNYRIASLAAREPVVGVASLNEDNSVQLDGDPRSFESLQDLMRTIDLLAKSLNEPEKPLRKVRIDPKDTQQSIGLLAKIRQRITAKKQPSSETE